ncbi:hypothetical protein OK348_13365 [Flavobacterium sp. MXW15]|uniref:Uncharacterized protein n=1 Tax=Xanthomonas chitinilytica TaxID=2989819 RepID=A0ABT3JWX3_9XANT|nr:hypothetical protein [Xanthomonas sp. H13-6]MCW4455775.1 hypothetical protein [Flavobacterium sp. MXW15]MCW4472991.1 hypothetical protein [Xanthomonas sp. H13-6]
MNTSRIPAYDRTHPNGMQKWFVAMAKQDLLFHPEDSATQIIHLPDGTPLFTEAEAAEADGVLVEMFAEHGNKVVDSCYSIFMKTAGFHEALNAR